MKKKHAAEAAPDEMRSHYDFDYSKSRPNRFADRPKVGCVRSASEEKPLKNGAR
jgi:hypothetical protein